MENFYSMIIIENSIPTHTQNIKTKQKKNINQNEGKICIKEKAFLMNNNKI
jgi:hypothetical protein